MTRQPRLTNRPAAATVEFAFVVPLFFLLILGAIDCGRAMMGLDLIANASRSGCRAGTLPQATNSDVTSAVDAHLSSGGVSGATTTVQVNGQPADVATARKGDQITVTVSVPFSSVNWLPTSWFFGGKTLSRSTVMRHE
ncbi:MAG: pilus assembly protein [Zavarzinella sp.]|nr:pilus assembly protein [Zavarzinella sp.]